MNQSTRYSDDVTDIMPPAATRWRYKPDARLKRAVRRVLIALSFRSDKHQQEPRSRSADRGGSQSMNHHQLVPWQWPSNGPIPASATAASLATSAGPNTQFWDPVCITVIYLLIIIDCHHYIPQKTIKSKK